MRVVTGKQLIPASPLELAELRGKAVRCLFDVGTGDGLYPYRWAREHPADLAVGLDPAAAGLGRLALKTQRKAAKGGAPNLLLVEGSLEDLPGPFAGWADLLVVNFPWGALLRALVEPVPQLLSKLSAVGRPGADFVFLLNASVFADEGYVERLALPPLSETRAREELVPEYLRAGLVVGEVASLAGQVPHHTTWGQRLVRGSHRQTLLVRGAISSEALAGAQETG